MSKVFCLIPLLLLGVLCFSEAYGSVSGEDSLTAPKPFPFVDSGPFQINVLMQVSGVYSMRDDDFRGGRSFNANNARIGLRGEWESGFFYRLYFNLVRTPTLLDAYIGYRVGDHLRIQMGAMKPRQNRDYIPNPANIDFAERSVITGLLSRSREMGIAAEGEFGRLYYYLGLFNGTGLSFENNNRFYGIGRLQYRLLDGGSGALEVGASASNGRSEGVQSGNAGPQLRGRRTIWGVDLRYENSGWLIAGDYLRGKLETVVFSDIKEAINGYYLTLGYFVREDTQVLGRWQEWEYEDRDLNEAQLTLGLNHHFDEMFAVRLNFDWYFRHVEDDQQGLSLMAQFVF